MDQHGCLDSLSAVGIDSSIMLAETFYAELSEELGEHPGQLEAFDRLLEYLDGNVPSSTWHAAMVGFGLGLAEDAEARVFVERAAAVFLMIATSADFPENSNDA